MFADFCTCLFATTATNPRDPATEIVYYGLNGPESSAYVRGSGELILGEGVVMLPEHFRDVVDIQTLTVTVTPLSAESLGLAVVGKGEDRFVVRELANGLGSYGFDYTVMATRNDAQGLPVIRPVQDYQAMVPQIDAETAREVEP